MASGQWMAIPCRNPESPPPNGVLWRYMDFAKFCDLLLRRSIHLCRLDLLGDGHEGYMPPTNVLRRVLKERQKKLGLDPSNGATYGDFVQLRGVAWAFRFLSYVSCWHFSNIESHGMWSAYLGDRPGVAIRTTAADLLAVARKAENEAVVGQVAYLSLDDDDAVFDLGSFAFRKRLHFAYENEVRLVIRREQFFKQYGYPAPGKLPINDWPKGLALPLDDFSFIHEVRISPRAPAWYTQLVAMLLERLEINAPVVDSELSAEPNWAEP